MIALEVLKTHGIEASLKGPENLVLKGLNNIQEPSRSEIIHLAKINKQKLICELLHHANKANNANKGINTEHSQCGNHAKKAKKGMDTWPEYFDEKRFEDLLKTLSARIRQDGRTIRFDPGLAGPKKEPERWRQAVELEQMFRLKLLAAVKTPSNE